MAYTVTLTLSEMSTIMDALEFREANFGDPKAVALHARLFEMRETETCPDCEGKGRGGANPTDGSQDDDCASCSGEGVR